MQKDKNHYRQALANGLKRAWRAAYENEKTPFALLAAVTSVTLAGLLHSAFNHHTNNESYGEETTAPSAKTKQAPTALMPDNNTPAKIRHIAEAAAARPMEIDAPVKPPVKASVKKPHIQQTTATMAVKPQGKQTSATLPQKLAAQAGEISELPPQFWERLVKKEVGNGKVLVNESYGARGHGQTLPSTFAEQISEFSDDLLKAQPELKDKYPELTQTAQIKMSEYTNAPKALKDKWHKLKGRAPTTKSQNSLNDRTASVRGGLVAKIDVSAPGSKGPHDEYYILDKKRLSRLAMDPQLNILLNACYVKKYSDYVFASQWRNAPADIKNYMSKITDTHDEVEAGKTYVGAILRKIGVPSKQTRLITSSIAHRWGPTNAERIIQAISEDRADAPAFQVMNIQWKSKAYDSNRRDLVNENGTKHLTVAGLIENILETYAGLNIKPRIASAHKTTPPQPI